MSWIACSKCAGEGKLYTSKYGGNDPDVWATGECDACKGSGNQVCEMSGCGNDAFARNADGEELCKSCLDDQLAAIRSLKETP